MRVVIDANLRSGIFKHRYIGYDKKNRTTYWILRTFFTIRIFGHAVTLTFDKQETLK